MQIASFYAGLCGVLFLVLSALVIRERVKFTIYLGDGDREHARRLIRVHGNFAEYVPLALILLFAAETSGAPNWLIHLAGSSLVVGRVLHALGLGRSSKWSAGRFIGTNLTFLAIGIGAVLALRGIL
ncbi:MAG: MAPEG family protein [Gemmatimonas sp.]